MDSETKIEIHKQFKMNLIVQDVLMAFDAVSLYPSAMFDENSEYPKAQSARPFNKSEENEFKELFNSQEFRPKCGIFKVYYEYPNNLFFQPIPAKDNITYTQDEKEYSQELIRFRNGKCYDVLTSVDIQEIVRCGGKILKIYDGIVYEENFKESPFKDFVKKLFKLRKTYKEEGNNVGYDLIKLLINSLYGKTIQKDILTKNHLWCKKH